MKLGIVTATSNAERAAACFQSWAEHASGPLLLHVVTDGLHGEYTGPVRAFAIGVEALLAYDPAVDVIACLHDDLRIDEDGWDAKVVRAFERHPEVGLLGFGGAIGLGAADIYRTPYDPMQLARVGFRSNLVDAEAHGSRSLLPEKVACLDGFSQIGRRAFYEQVHPWRTLVDAGFIHHFYDGALGCLAKRAGWEVFYLPIRCQHFGGQTAVGDQAYHAWAARQINGGDRGFWEKSHRLGYDLFQDVLPLRVDQAG